MYQWVSHLDSRDYSPRVIDKRLIKRIKLSFDINISFIKKKIWKHSNNLHLTLHNSGGFRPRLHFKIFFSVLFSYPTWSLVHSLFHFYFFFYCKGVPQIYLLEIPITCWLLNLIFCGEYHRRFLYFTYLYLIILWVLKM